MSDTFTCSYCKREDRLETFQSDLCSDCYLNLKRAKNRAENLAWALGHPPSCTCHGCVSTRFAVEGSCPIGVRFEGHSWRCNRENDGHRIHRYRSDAKVDLVAWSDDEVVGGALTHRTEDGRCVLVADATDPPVPADGPAETAEMVNHPKHYNSHPSGVECIVIVEHMTFNAGSAVKYLWRAGLKGSPKGSNTVEDLKKAAWYVAREIERLEKEGAK